MTTTIPPAPLVSVTLSVCVGAGACPQARAATLARHTCQRVSNFLSATKFIQIGLYYELKLTMTFITVEFSPVRGHCASMGSSLPKKDRRVLPFFQRLG